MSDTGPDTAAGQRVALVSGAGEQIEVRVSRDGLQTLDFLPALTAPNVPLGRHRSPRVAVTKDGLVVAAMSGAQGGGKDGDVILWRDDEQSRAGSQPRTLNSVPAAAREGLHAMAASSDTVAAVWLDLRQQGTTLYGTVSLRHRLATAPSRRTAAAPGRRTASSTAPRKGPSANAAIPRSSSGHGLNSQSCSATPWQATAISPSPAPVTAGGGRPGPSSAPAPGG